MPTTEKTMYLPEILAHTRAVVAERKAFANLRALERAAAAHQPRGFAQALRAKAAAEGLAVIAEVKKASPSKGLIRENFDAAQIAAQLERGGAAVLSVLTDEKFFQGSLENLQRASAAVRIPCLRKDFMVDEFQVLEARAHCADAILLIVAALTDAELRTLRASARHHGLDVLCEVHDAEELERARDLGCECVGVNSRDLRTFEVSLDRACELAAALPHDAVKVAESGIHTAADIQRLRSAGYDAFLIGESLMRKPDPGEALRELLSEVSSKAGLKMFVKICANTNVEDARLAAELGADAVGFVFAPSKRQVNAEQVAAITSQLPTTVEKVGVFTTTDSEEILRIAEFSGLSSVQLHSNFNPDLLEAVIAGSGESLKVFQVVDVPEGSDGSELEALLTSILKHEQVFAALLDASHAGTSGGTGKTFNWSATAEMVKRVQRETGGRIIVAGGLNPDNVAEAIAAFAPFGVDVASGVEACYGHKDPQKIKAFLAAARGAHLSSVTPHE